MSHLGLQLSTQRETIGQYHTLLCFKKSEYTRSTRIRSEAVIANRGRV